MSKELLDPTLRFYGYREFCSNCVYFRSLAQKMHGLELEIYQNYIYSRAFISEYLKDLMWSFLMESEDSPYFVSREILLYELKRVENRVK